MQPLGPVPLGAGLFPVETSFPMTAACEYEAPEILDSLFHP